MVAILGRDELHAVGPPPVCISRCKQAHKLGIQSYSQQASLPYFRSSTLFLAACGVVCARAAYGMGPQYFVLLPVVAALRLGHFS